MTVCSRISRESRRGAFNDGQREAAIAQLQELCKSSLIFPRDRRSRGFGALATGERNAIVKERDKRLSE